MFVALSRFTIRNGMADEVCRAFSARPHRVDKAAGYIGLRVMSPDESAAEIWLVTRCTDEPSHRTRHGSHDYHESHSAIPKGPRLVPRSAEIRFFDLLAEWPEGFPCPSTPLPSATPVCGDFRIFDPMPSTR